MRIFLLFFANIGMVFVFMLLWFLSIKQEKYTNNYHSVVNENREYLKKTYGEKRVVLMGGSSVNFTFSAEMLSKDLGVKVRNLGRSAGYGLENIWKMHKDFLNPTTDIIVLSPEYGLMQESYDNKFLSIIMCQLVYTEGSLKELQEYRECAPYVVKRVFKDVGEVFEKKKIKKKNIYEEKGVNEYGDTINHYGEKSTYSNKNNERVNIEKLKIAKDSYMDFITKNILEKGFKVIYVPVTIEESRVFGIEEEIKKVQLELVNFFGGEPEDIEDILWYEKEYFFDSDVHASEAGRIKKHPKVKKILERELREAGRL